MAIEIRLTQNKVAIIDNEDYLLISKYKWQAQFQRGIWYAIATYSKNNRSTTIRMHRLIMNIESGVQIDHRDGDGLNNCRNNLRICTISQNRANSEKRTPASSKYKGVRFDKKSKKWMVRISCNNIRKYLGSYKTEDEAAMIYNEQAKLLFGEFAKLNQVA